MYRSLLVPLDGSDFGEHALAAAYGIARRAAGESPIVVHLAQVHIPIVTAYLEGYPLVDEELDRAVREAERAYLDAARRRFADDPAIKVRTRLLDGNIAESLANYATSQQIDLIVMTTHGRGGLARAWLGSVADELVRRGVAPTLLLRPQAEPPDRVAEQVFQRILVPLDGSESSEAILRAVIPLARLMHASLTLLRVVEPVSIADISAYRSATTLSERLLNDLCDDAEMYLKRIAGRVAAEGVAVQTQVLVSAWPSAAILDEARVRSADLIAMTTRGRGGLERLLLGSTADKVLRAAAIPVLLQRPQVGTVALVNQDEQHAAVVA